MHFLFYFKNAHKYFAWFHKTNLEKTTFDEFLEHSVLCIRILFDHSVDRGC